MESRLKERLTGAAILVALIVLIVPEVFHGRRSHGGRPTPASAAPATATRTYTIELGNPAAPTAGKAGAPDIAPVAPAPVVPVVPAAPVQAPVAAARPPPPAKPAKPAPAPKAEVATAAPRPPPTVASRREISRTGAHGWSVQLGLFAREGNARRLAHTAQGKGIAVDVTRFGARGLYRVAVAGLADRAAAEQIAHRLHGAGLPAAILGPR